MKTPEDILDSCLDFVKQNQPEGFKEKIKEFDHDTLIVLFTHDSHFFYHKLKEERTSQEVHEFLKNIPLSVAIQLPEEMCLDYVKSIPYSDYPAVFLTNIKDKPALIHIRKNSSDKILNKILSGFKDADLPKLRAKLDELYENQTVLKTILDKEGADQSEIIKSYTFQLDERRLEKFIFEYYILIPAQDTIFLLKQLGQTSRQSVLMCEVDNNFYFYEKLCSKPDLNLSQFIPLFDKQLNMGILDKLVRRFLTQMNEESERISAINALLPQMSDPLKSSLILNHHETLGIKLIVMILDKMTFIARFNLFLMKTKSGILIEDCVRLCQNDLQHFMSLFAILEDSSTRYKLYSHPIQFGTKKVYTDNRIANSAAGAISAAAAYLPIFGVNLQKTAETMQTEVPLDEFLLVRIFRLFPQYLLALPSLLDELKPEDATTLLRQADALNQTILMKIIKHADLDVLLGVFCKLHYETKDQDKLFDPKKYPLNKLKSELKDNRNSEALIGFIAFITIYNYLCVRSREGYPQQYEINKGDFLSLFHGLLNVTDKNMISRVLEDYFSKNPLEEGYQLSSAVAPIKIRSTRYKDARDQLSLLTIPELNQGIELFIQFVQKRIAQDEKHDVNSLDYRLYSLIERKKQSLSLTA